MFAKSVVMLGSSEENSALSCALSDLAKVEDKLQQLHQEEAFSDFFLLSELLADYVRLLGAVQVKKHLLCICFPFKDLFSWKSLNCFI